MKVDNRIYEMFLKTSQWFLPDVAKIKRTGGEAFGNSILNYYIRYIRVERNTPFHLPHLPRQNISVMCSVQGYELAHCSNHLSDVYPCIQHTTVTCSAKDTESLSNLDGLGLSRLLVLFQS